MDAKDVLISVGNGTWKGLDIGILGIDSLKVSADAIGMGLPANTFEGVKSIKNDDGIHMSIALGVMQDVVDTAMKPSGGQAKSAIIGKDDKVEGDNVVIEIELIGKGLISGIHEATVNGQAWPIFIALDSDADALTAPKVLDAVGQQVAAPESSQCDMDGKEALKEIDSEDIDQITDTENVFEGKNSEQIGNRTSHVVTVVGAVVRTVGTASAPCKCKTQRTLVTKQKGFVWTSGVSSRCKERTVARYSSHPY